MRIPQKSVTSGGGCWPRKQGCQGREGGKELLTAESACAWPSAKTSDIDSRNILEKSPLRQNIRKQLVDFTTNAVIMVKKRVGALEKVDADL